MNSKKVSVIIPVYNATCKQLKKSIESVINQSYDDIECIIVNDCSTSSETIDYLRKIHGKTAASSTTNNEKKVQIYNNLVNAGISASRNRGIDVSSGEYICFLDQDDYYDKDFVENLVNSIDKEDADIAMCGFYTLDESDSIIGKFPRKDMDINLPCYPWSICAVWNRIYKREFIIQHDIRFPKGKVTEDIIFLMQCNIWSKKTVAVKKALYRNVVRQSSTSHSKEFHSLSFEQMPFMDIKRIVSSYNDTDELQKRSYLNALVCNELALLCFVLSLGSEKITIKKAAKQAGGIIRDSLTGNVLQDIFYFNNYCGDKKIMQVLILLIYLSSKLYLEQLTVYGVHIFMRLWKIVMKEK